MKTFPFSGPQGSHELSLGSSQFTSTATLHLIGQKQPSHRTSSIILVSMAGPRLDLDGEPATLAWPLWPLVPIILV